MVSSIQSRCCCAAAEAQRAACSLRASEKSEWAVLSMDGARPPPTRRGAVWRDMDAVTQQDSVGSQSGNQDIVFITAEPLVLGALAARVVCGTAGGIATFIGTTRDNFEGRRVLRLEYEAYQPMAERELLAICKRMRDRWPLRHVAIAHRIGLVPIGESSVEIAVSSAHRREALEAVQFAIDDLKKHVPIWKKEIYEGDAAAWKENAEAAQTNSSIQSS